MNVEDYISSGIVESYVLGLAEEAEKAEFEEMCRQHPSVLAARISFEETLDRYAHQQAIEPPGHLRQAVFSKIGIVSGEEAPQAPVLPINTETRARYGNTQVVSLNTRLKYMAAASVILLIGSAILNFYFFSQYKDYSARYSDLLASQQQMVKNNEAMQTKLQSYEEDINLVNDTNTVVVRMPGTNVATSPAPASLATVYWNKASKDVYLHISSMPKASEGKQYQLWALVDGKPVDAGVFDVKDDKITLKMKNIPRAQAFAVTLEKQGGSPTPTMEQLYVLGKV